MKGFACLSDDSYVVHEIAVIWSLFKKTIYKLTNVIHPITVIVRGTLEISNDNNAGI
jgi:hypothetical protein